MLKLTRLNNAVVAINPDHVYAADATPDTTLRLIGGEMIIVRESLDELLEKVLEYRRSVRMPMTGDHDGDANAVAVLTQRQPTDSDAPPKLGQRMSRTPEARRLFREEVPTFQPPTLRGGR